MEKERFIIAENINREIEICDVTIKNCTDCIDKMNNQCEFVWVNNLTLHFNNAIPDVYLKGSNIKNEFVLRLLKEIIHEAKKNRSDLQKQFEDL